MRKQENSQFHLFILYVNATNVMFLISLNRDYRYRCRSRDESLRAGALIWKDI